MSTQDSEVAVWTLFPRASLPLLSFDPVGKGCDNRNAHFVHMEVPFRAQSEVTLGRG